MRAIVCDKCQLVITDKEKLPKVKQVRVGTEFEEGRTLHLCDECIQALGKWIEGEKMDKTIENCELIKIAKRVGAGETYHEEESCIGYSIGKFDEPHEACKQCKFFESYEE